MRILLVEDDKAIGSAVRDHTTADNHAVDWATSLSAAYDHAAVATAVVFWPTELPARHRQPKRNSKYCRSALYLVYNARPRAAAGDTEDQYFAHTEAVAGVQDLRQQRLTVDVLHWLGVTRVDRWLSMSNMKRDALTHAGIEIVNQMELPGYLVDHAARVEIGAKKNAGYYSKGRAA